MNITKWLPYIASFILFAGWFALVILGQADATEFITAVVGALSGMGVHNVHKLKGGE